jgi:hypothetical protein
LAGIGGVSGSEPTYSAEVTGEGVHGLSCTATDVAGNTSGVATDTVRIDLTAPTASPSASPAPNANGWNNTSVTVSFTGSDDLSGTDSCEPAIVLAPTALASRPRAPVRTRRATSAHRPRRAASTST